ncbi:MAG: hypothetical protein KJ017_04305 [Alphaproteobacteria bacterium]|nr:hypothetical protein [Alphaproteobacteria bacterium]
MISYDDYKKYLFGYNFVGDVDGEQTIGVVPLVASHVTKQSGSNRQDK